MNTRALLAHGALDAAFMRCERSERTVHRYLADVQALAARMTTHRFVLPATSDRYRFAVAFGAAASRGAIAILPTHLNRDMVERLKVQCDGDLIALVDDAPVEGLTHIAIETDRIEADASAPLGTPSMPRIEDDRVVAWVYTSGSTGEPLPHAKRWGALCDSVDAAATQLGLTTPHAIVATVPPQHMFGFESTVLLAMRAYATAASERPFYPADVVAALERAPAPRLLVTTPFHLRALLEAEVGRPRIERILSATAPLSRELARQAEETFGATLHEIYGCTETGQIATRRTTHDATWTALAGVRLRERDGVFDAHGGHVGAPVALGDTLVLDGDTRFTLAGRTHDLVNVAGKRTSLAALNHHLNAIPGVRDGAFFVPDEPDTGGVARLVAFAVAPGLAASQIVAALRARVDEVFLPRPLVLVEALPRNAAGKLARAALAALVAEHVA